MLIGAILCTAVAVVVVYLFVRGATVDPKTWAKRHDKVDERGDHGDERSQP